ncbi:glycosyltransferase [Kamptonema cortianum]|nr:glycosyltransferase [Kamptonema cortianum]
MIRRKLPHADMLALHAEARVSIGLSIGDGISTSFLEAMAAGAFPVQSDTSCASEWARHETSCLLVPPEDIDAITTALRRALSDDTLVDTASLINWETVKQRLDRRMICGQILQFYQTVHQGKRA